MLKNQLNWLNSSIRFLIINENEDFSAEQVNSNAFLFSGFLISSLSCIFNFVEGFNTILNVFTIFSSFLLITLYYFSRFRNYSNIWLSASTILFLLSITWFMNGGATGSTSFMYLYTVIVLNIIAERHQQNGLFFLILSNIIVLYILEYLLGDLLIRPYANTSNQYCDIVFVFLLILIGVFYTTRFIKRLHDRERNRVKERTKELEQSNEKRTNVFINLAHETKTPLTLISNYLEDFIRKNGLEKDKDLKLLKNAVGNLTKDIVNFFDMEKIQKGIDMYDHHQISNFSELLDNSIKLFRVIAAKKQIKITTSITDNLLVMADPSSVIRIINNLIENAIKYTNPEGEIIIKLYEGNNNIYFSVKDNGIGISDSFRNKVFEPYFQINSEKSNFQGMGLGLSIVKKITDELAGKIELYSDPGKSPGTEMIIQLPRSESKVTGWSVEQFVQPAEIDVVTIPDQVFDEDKYTIMVVEDNIALLNYIVTKLQENYNVYFARNGQEAIHKIKTLLQLDLIISDVMMDDGDGFYLYQHLNASKKFNHLPLLFLTAKQETETRIKGLSMGAIDYISKPFVIDELDRKINSILTNRINYRNAIVTQAYNAISNTRIRNLSNGSDSFDENCTKYKLTPREMEVIQLMADGKITKEIASLLNISVDTVKKHIRNSYEKTGVNCKFELLKKLSH